MWVQFWKQLKTNTSFALYVKCGAILLLLLLSVLVVACGSSANDNSLGQSDVTVTIDLGQSNGSPTPPLPEYTCSAWATNTSPGLNTPVVGIYAKYVHNINGNPVGVDQSTATATVHWPEGDVSSTTTTTADGLAVFPFSTTNRVADLNKIIRVTVSFQSTQSAPACDVSEDRAAFFSLISSSTTTGTPGTVGSTPSPGATGTATGTGTPTPSPVVDPTPDPTPKPCPTPKPGKKTPTPCP
ncbi:MAG: hypothetical protein NVS4B7_13810 [Ktedonobacteraceae bacterium]